MKTAGVDHFTVTAEDRDLFRRLIRDSVPERIFDAQLRGNIPVALPLLKTHSIKNNKAVIRHQRADKNHHCGMGQYEMPEIPDCKKK